MNNIPSNYGSNLFAFLYVIFGVLLIASSFFIKIDFLERFGVNDQNFEKYLKNEVWIYYISIFLIAFLGLTSRELARFFPKKGFKSLGDKLEMSLITSFLAPFLKLYFSGFIALLLFNVLTNIYIIDTLHTFFFLGFFLIIFGVFEFKPSKNNEQNINTKEFIKNKKKHKAKK